MKIFKVILQLVVVVLLNLVVFAAWADCPKITDIISTFNKNGLPPKGWLLVSYTGKQIDQDFYFAKATWSANSVNMTDRLNDGNVDCEYVNKTKINPGFLIIQTTAAVATPKGNTWQQQNNEIHTTLCKGSGNPDNCKF